MHWTIFECEAQPTNTTVRTNTFTLFPLSRICYWIYRHIIGMEWGEKNNFRVSHRNIPYLNRIQCDNMPFTDINYVTQTRGKAHRNRPHNASMSLGKNYVTQTDPRLPTRHFQARTTKHFSDCYRIFLGIFIDVVSSESASTDGKVGNKMISK